MPLSDDQIATFKTWLRKFPNIYPRGCPACTVKDGDPLEPGEIIAPSSRDGNTLYLAELVCRHCGRVLLFDAKKIGLV